MSSLRLLNYFYTCRGLGHTARFLRIAVSLSQALIDSSVLVLTTLPAPSRSRQAEWVDYFLIPTLETDVSNRFSSRFRRRLKTASPNDGGPAVSVWRALDAMPSGEAGRPPRGKIVLEASARGHARKGPCVSATKQV